MQHIDINTHLNAPWLRIDTWNALAALVNKLHWINDVEKSKAFEEEFEYFLKILKPIEKYHAFPGITLCAKIENHFFKNEFDKLHELVTLVVQALSSRSCNYKEVLRILQSERINLDDFVRALSMPNIYYFEVLVVNELSETRKDILKIEMEGYSTPNEKFVYELVFVNSFEDAMIAIMFNFHIKCCLISDFFTFDSKTQIPAFKSLIQQANILTKPRRDHETNIPAVELGNAIRSLRQQELDILYISSHEPEKIAGSGHNSFNKIFYDFENHYELHLTLLQGITNHFNTPFFDSLKKYAFEPKSAFHALPIARGKSVFDSRWIRDMEEFYGKNIFLAESSSTAGGLDSLLHPLGSIKAAMKKAADYFGAHETFFVTNGTSASNKVVLQALLAPGDIVLIEHTCHQSHHYGIIMSGAYPIYLNGYSVSACDISGPVPLRTIKEHLLLLKKNNMLDKVKLIVLTNCTFDGLVYNVQKYMEEILALKPDMIFLWDEAWFAYARCVPHYRLRTGMYAAASLEKKYSEPEYRKQYKDFLKQLKENENSDEFLLNNSLLPDPDQVKVRVYCTQSTHKTLSCMRQGSMIHVYDHHFFLTQEKFTHAFLTHSTTSPNYQIIATLDLARRQAELEGFELVQNAIELSMIFRQQVNKNPLINEYFQALGPSELIPEEFRLSKVASSYEATRDWGTVERAWVIDEFVVDPTRATLLIKNSFSGYFMKEILMDRFGIQVNKISSKSILVQFNIGTSRSSVSYLLESLLTLATELRVEGAFRQKSEQPGPTKLLSSPNFTEFSPDFRAYPKSSAGDLRKAFYAGQETSRIEYLPIKEILKRLKAGETIVSASIVIPVPPGSPALLPGQIITEPILHYLSSINPKSIIGGYSPKIGLKVFTR